MKRHATTTLYVFALIALLSLSVHAQEKGHHGQGKHGGEHGMKEHSFGASEFDAFHDLLHPLQHEALPKNDFKTIRAKAPALVRAGQVINRRATPAGVNDRAAYKRNRQLFANALARFKRDAARGTDEQLKASYTSVHDTFEELARMLPQPERR